MNIQELSQLKFYSKEIENLKKQLREAEYRIEVDTTSDSVTGSMPLFPYVQHVIKISGIDVDGYDKQVNRLRSNIKRRIKELMDKMTEAQEYIATIPDSETRLILQCRFINGLTWEQIEDETGINQRTAHRKYKSWFEKK